MPAARARGQRVVRSLPGRGRRLHLASYLTILTALTTQVEAAVYQWLLRRSPPLRAAAAAAAAAAAGGGVGGGGGGGRLAARARLATRDASHVTCLVEDDEGGEGAEGGVAEVAGEEMGAREEGEAREVGEVNAAVACGGVVACGWCSVAAMKPFWEVSKVSK